MVHWYRAGEKIQCFDVVIRPGRSKATELRELWSYKYLIWLMVKRDFIVRYKQTVLGPAWAFIQPVMNTLILALVFGRIAGLSPDGIPEFLFYMSGQIVWIFFSGSLSRISTTFIDNAHVMSKVYYPRLTAPVVTLCSFGITGGIQVIMFVGIYLWYILRGTVFMPDPLLLFLLPAILLQVAMLALGTGIVISGLTTRYRDLVMLVSFGISLWMYLGPIAYDISIVPEKYLRLYMLNPLTVPIQLVRSAFFGTVRPAIQYCLLSIVITAGILILGLRTFSRVERTFIDTV